MGRKIIIVVFFISVTTYFLSISNGIGHAETLLHPPSTVEVRSSLLSEVDRGKLKDLIEKSIARGEVKIAPMARLVNQPWTRVSRLPRARVETAGQLNVTGFGVEDGTERVKVALTAAGLDQIASHIMPTIANGAGMDNIAVDDFELASGSFDFICKGSWKIEARSIDLRLPVGSNDMKADFQSGNKLDVQLDQDGAYFRATVAFIINAKDACIVLPDEAFDLAKVTFSIADLVIDLNTSFEPSGNRIQIRTINNLDVDIGSFDFGNSFLNALTDFGFSVAKVFGSSCSTIEGCINKQLENHVAHNADVQNGLLLTLNDALDIAISVSDGAYRNGSVSADYQVALVSLGVDLDSALVSRWSVTMNRTGSIDACAAGLTYTKKTSRAEVLKFGGHLDAILPVWLIEKALHIVGKQAAFCVTEEGFFPEALSAKNKDGRITGSLLRQRAKYSGRVVPHGMITINPQIEGGIGTFKMNLPLRMMISVSINDNSKRLVQDITASLTLTTSFRDDGLKIALGSAVIAGLPETLHVGGEDIDLSSLITAFENAINTQVGGLEIPIIPTVTAVSDFLTVELTGIRTVGGALNKTGISAELSF